MNSFEEYLAKKKIDSARFRQENTMLWEEWEHLFGQMHPDSFTAQKLFLINKVRRMFPVQSEIDSEVKTTVAQSSTSQLEEPKKD